MTDSIEQERMTAINTLQILFSTIANSGDWVGQENISDDFYKELKVCLMLLLGRLCIFPLDRLSVFELLEFLMYSVIWFASVEFKWVLSIIDYSLNLILVYPRTSQQPQSCIKYTSQET